MPYRRLPNTDVARLRALQMAIQRASEVDFSDQFLSYKTVSEAERFVMQFENQMHEYHDNVNNKVSANKQYRHVVQNARMYLSHFIQVLNMSITRGEIKKERRTLYGLDINSSSLPDLSTEEMLLSWGKKIIEGEQERVAQGGFPIYNPSINKVKVYYDIFCEKQFAQTQHRKSN